MRSQEILEKIEKQKSSPMVFQLTSASASASAGLGLGVGATSDFLRIATEARHTMASARATRERIEARLSPTDSSRPVPVQYQYQYQYQ